VEQVYSASEGHVEQVLYCR